MIDVKVYTTTYCGYCNAAIALLKRKNIPFEKIDCSGDGQIRQWLVEQTGLRTVPQIFLGGVPIGGYDELAELEQQDQLDDIMAGTIPPPSVL